MNVMKKLFGILIVLLCFNVGAEVSKEVEDKIKKSFQASLPSLKIDSIQQSRISDLYEVVSGPVVMYVTKNADYAISGDILDLRDGKTNITEAARKKARLQAISKLENVMILYKAAKPKFTVTVFTDLDCVYCRKFHSQIDELNRKGITVRYLAFPRAGNQSSSYEKAVSVWCAEDKAKALTLAKQGQPVAPARCDAHKIDEQFHLGVMAGISGTPSMILQDGTLLPGYYEPDNLLGILQQSTKSDKHIAKSKQPSKKS